MTVTGEALVASIHSLDLMSRQLSVLVTDPDQRAALAATRSLVRAGHRVLTFGPTKGLAGRSRGVYRHVLSSPVERLDVEVLQSRVLAAVREHRIDAVYPITDSSCRWLLPLQGLPSLRVIGPSVDAYERASNKSLIVKVAHGLGMCIPKQVVLDAWQRSVAELPWKGDTVVKPSSSTALVDGRVEKFGVEYASDLTELNAVLRRLPPAVFPLLLQERCGGEGAGVFLLRAQRTTLMAFGHRRIREKPPSGGVSTCRESIVPPAGLLMSCEQLLDELAYEGPAMIEFKRDVKSGRWVLMEINARLWGSVQLAVDAGVDFPIATLQWAIGEPVTISQAKTNVRTTWELGEIDHAIALLRGSAASLHLPHGTQVGWRAAMRALADRSWSERPEMFRFSDPWPAAAELAGWLGDLLSIRRSYS